MATRTPRSARLSRATKETRIAVKLTLDGKGVGRIASGLAFFDHMLEQLARHSGMDLEVKAKGDLHIDEHHTVEDAAIAIGEALKSALGDKRGIARYGHARLGKGDREVSVLLPMDEALATCALDFSGRTVVVFRGTFKREKVGDLPTELVEHFFETLARHSGMNLHLYLAGKNEHHMIEAAFKSLARALRMAVRIESDRLPTTKGVLV